MSSLRLRRCCCCCCCWKISNHRLQFVLQFLATKVLLLTNYFKWNFFYSISIYRFGFLRLWSMSSTYLGGMCMYRVKHQKFSIKIIPLNFCLLIIWQFLLLPFRRILKISSKKSYDFDRWLIHFQINLFWRLSLLHKMSNLGWFFGAWKTLQNFLFCCILLHSTTITTMMIMTRTISTLNLHHPKWMQIAIILLPNPFGNNNSSSSNIKRIHVACASYLSR